MADQTKEVSQSFQIGTGTLAIILGIAIGAGSISQASPNRSTTPSALVLQPKQQHQMGQQPPRLLDRQAPSQQIQQPHVQQAHQVPDHQKQQEPGLPQEAARVVDSLFEYASGRELREEWMDSPHVPYLKEEIGQFLSVPLDHSNPSGPKTEIYVFTMAPFDSNRPTLAYLSGGPGQNSHDLRYFAKVLSQWNVLFFDQRGTGFSKPETIEMLKSRSYTSSLTVVKDLDFIRQHLQIEKLSLYGHSYGTVPATMYASLYPQHTRAVILEGVVDHGAPELWTARHRLKILERTFRRLPPSLREKVVALHEVKALPRTWFYDLAKGLMYSPDFENLLIEKLRMALASSDPVLALQAYSDRSYFYQDSFFVGAFTMAHIGCSELSLQEIEATWDFAFEQGRFVALPNPLRHGLCQHLGWTPDQKRTYDSRNYPLTVPVTYFQGTTDGATVAPFAVHHFKRTAQSQAQLFLIKGEGHTPMHTLMEKAETGFDYRPVVEQLLEPALHGHFIQDQDLRRLNETLLANRWKRALKKRKP